MLPGADGWAVLREIRDKKQTPVLFLTARDDVADRVRGLELGADDYLVKPFAFSELLARRALGAASRSEASPAARSVGAVPALRRNFLPGMRSG